MLSFEVHCEKKSTRLLGLGLDLLFVGVEVRCYFYQNQTQRLTQIVREKNTGYRLDKRSFGLDRLQQVSPGGQYN